MVRHLHAWDEKSKTTLASICKLRAFGSKPLLDFRPRRGPPGAIQRLIEMNESIIIQADLTARPVQFYAELWRKDSTTLNAWCRKGWIPGAFKHGSGEWWVRPIELIHFDPSTIEERNEQKTTKGPGNSGESGKPRIQSTKNNRRTARLRYDAKDKT